MNTMTYKTVQVNQFEEASSVAERLDSFNSEKIVRFHSNVKPVKGTLVDRRTNQPVEDLSTAGYAGEMLKQITEYVKARGHETTDYLIIFSDDSDNVFFNNIA